MTREEAIIYLEGMRIVPSENWKELADERNEVIDMAIEALKGGDAEMSPLQKPTTTPMQQSPNNGADLISRAVPIHEDGTLEVKVPNAQKVGRVLVMDTNSHIGGGLFYPDDTVYGEWQRVDEQPYFRKHYHKVCCSVCHKQGSEKYNFCPNCGARMEATK